MKSQQSVKHLEKIMNYVLGRRPDEFGLVPDPDGWVKIKDLLKALNEEDGWRHIRRGHINEMLISHPAPEIELEDNRIRAKYREHLSTTKLMDQPPKLLYTCVRRRAYPAVQEKGIFVSGEDKILLTADPDLARRIGKRRDPNPVLLTVRVEQAIENGMVYQQSGKELFLADFIPAGTFSGPALPKEKAESAKKPSDEARPFRPDAGTFMLDPARVAPDDRHKESQKMRKDKEWKKERRQQRKHKERSRGSF